MTTTDPLEVTHALPITLAPDGRAHLILADLMAGVAAALDAGAPVDARADIDPRRSDRGAGRRLVLSWATTPAPPPGRGLVLLRRLRSGIPAIVRLRRG